MKTINLKKEVQGTVTSVIERLTEALKTEGFGVLTRIDLDTKFKEKLGAVIPSTVILGACNPALAYEAYKRNTDVASLLPCNAVVREIVLNRISVELIKPTAMMEILGDSELVNLSKDADAQLQRVLDQV